MIGLGLGLGFRCGAARRAPSSNTSLSVFTVNGSAVTDGATVDLANGTTSVTVVATPADPGASAVVNGDSGVATGDNSLTVTVTAADGVTQQVYTVDLHVINTGAVEITNVTTVADSGGSLSGAYFTIYDANGSVGIYMDAGAIAEVMQINFYLTTQVDFETGGDGMYVVFQGICYWFYAGSETQPSVSGVSNYQMVDLSNLDVSGYNQGYGAPSLLAAVIGPGADSSGNIIRLTAQTTGPQPLDGGNGGVFTVTFPTPGQNEPSAPSGFNRTIRVPFTVNDIAAQIANDIASAVTGDSAWSNVYDNSDGKLAFTDAAVGPRTPASAGTSGFIVVETQAGANPS
jgi:hypothetical protein